MILTYKPTQSRVGLVCRESEVQDGEVYRIIFDKPMMSRDAKWNDCRKEKDLTYMRVGLDAHNLCEKVDEYSDRSAILPDHFLPGNERILDTWLVRIRRCN